MRRPPLVIVGSARSDGDMAEAVAAVSAGREADIVDLLRHRVDHYVYDGRYEADDFPALAQLMAEHDRLVFATPVYWYAMSGRMKVFLDRLTDLVTIRKQDGRALAGRRCWLLSCGAEAAAPEGFEVPFRRTCDYFDMRYEGGFYWPSTLAGEQAARRAREAAAFAASVFGD